MNKQHCILITTIIMVAFALPFATAIRSAEGNSYKDTWDDYYFGSVEVFGVPESKITVIVGDDDSANVSMVLNTIPYSGLGISGTVKIPIQFPSNRININFVGVGSRITDSQRTRGIKTHFFPIEYQREIGYESTDVIIDIPAQIRNDAVIRIDYTVEGVLEEKRFDFPLSSYTTITDLLVILVFDLPEYTIEFDSFSSSPPPSDNTYSLIKSEIGKSSLYLIFENVRPTNFSLSLGISETIFTPEYLIQLSSTLTFLAVLALAIAFRPIKTQTNIFTIANRDFIRGSRRYAMAIIGVSIQAAVTSLSVVQSEVIKREVSAVLGAKYAPIIEPYTLLLIIITIVIGSFLVINSILTSLLERIREFGIMKAIGFGPRFIFKLTIFESAIIGIIGGLLGCSFGVLSALAPYLTIRTYLPIPYPFELHYLSVFILTPAGFIIGRLISKRWKVAFLCGIASAILIVSFPLALVFYASTVSIRSIFLETVGYYVSLLGLSVTLSIISGLCPAIWISKIKPVEAIRKTI